jgi:hypothetical protein
MSYIVIQFNFILLNSYVDIFRITKSTWNVIININNQNLTLQLKAVLRAVGP